MEKSLEMTHLCATFLSYPVMSESFCLCDFLYPEGGYRWVGVANEI